MGDIACDLNRNITEISSTMGDSIIDDYFGSDEDLNFAKKGGFFYGDIDNTEIRDSSIFIDDFEDDEAEEEIEEVLQDKFKMLEIKTGPEKGDDSSTTSSGVSSGGSASLSNSTLNSPSKTTEKKKFDISLNNWNIWQEDSSYTPRSDSEDEDHKEGFKRFRESRSISQGGGSTTKKTKLNFLKRFSFSGSHTISGKPKESIQLKSKSRKSEIKVDSLPQYFVAKYLGCRRSSGLYGLKHIRKPVDEMIEAVGKMRRNEELTLAQIHITKKGVHLSAHQDNKGSDLPSEYVPIEFLSYGVQDFVHTRVFCLIIVRTIARHGKKMECHAFVCNCSATSKKMALSVAFAFEKYAEALKDKPHKFEVDLKVKEKREEEKKKPLDTDGDCDA